MYMSWSLKVFSLLKWNRSDDSACNGYTSMLRLLIRRIKQIETNLLFRAYLSGGTTDVFGIFKQIRCDCGSRLSSALDLAFSLIKKMIRNKQWWILGQTSWFIHMHVSWCMQTWRKAEKVWSVEKLRAQKQKQDGRTELVSHRAKSTGSTGPGHKDNGVF